VEEWFDSVETDSPVEAPEIQHRPKSRRLLAGSLFADCRFAQPHKQVAEIPVARVIVEGRQGVDMRPSLAPQEIMRGADTLTESLLIDATRT
jgi:hypothetical protein